MRRTFSISPAICGFRMRSSARSIAVSTIKGAVAGSRKGRE
jgi:hypothetical protein